MAKLKKKLTGVKLIALGYLIVILIGALMLCMPFSSREYHWTPFIDAIFTATSATCVTGLVIYDTFSHWTIFGQIVILLLIQIGGIGFMTIITLFSMFLRRKIGLYERKVLMQSEGLNRVSGVMILLKRIIKLTLLFEISGTILLSIRFIGDFGWARGIYFGIFHSISAFCNAGFDLMGIVSPLSSFSSYSNDPLVCLTLIILIIVGGLGFLVWGDIIDCKGNVKKFSLHTKVVLIATISLILSGWILFFILEYNASMKGMSVWNKILASLFQSITPRTAGFNTIDMSALSNGGNMITMIFMFIGGSTGSTAGGVKVTTIVIVIMGLISAARNEYGVEINKKRILPMTIFQAFSIVIMYLLSILLASVIMMTLEPYSIKQIIFETVSAIGTVGLSTGITSGLTVASKIILMLLMFMGRIGAFSLLMAFAEKKENPPVKRPSGNILIG